MKTMRLCDFCEGKILARKAKRIGEVQYIDGFNIVKSGETVAFRHPNTGKLLQATSINYPQRGKISVFYALPADPKHGQLPINGAFVLPRETEIRKYTGKGWHP